MEHSSHASGSFLGSTAMAELYGSIKLNNISVTFNPYTRCIITASYHIAVW